jgi:hypothetical protein
VRALEMWRGVVKRGLPGQVTDGTSPLGVDLRIWKLEIQIWDVGKEIRMIFNKEIQQQRVTSRYAPIM